MRHPISERGATATGHRSRSSTRLRAPRLPLAIWRASCAPVVRAGSSGTRVCATCGTRTRANGRGQLARTQIRIRHGISSTGPFLASQFSFSANPPEEQPGDQSVKRADILPTVSLVCRAQSAERSGPGLHFAGRMLAFTGSCTMVQKAERPAAETYCACRCRLDAIARHQFTEGPPVLFRRPPPCICQIPHCRQDLVA